MYTNHFGLERRIFRGNATGADVFVGVSSANVLSPEDVQRMAVDPNQNGIVLFGSRKKNSLRSETLVMITPTVVESAVDLNRISEELEDEFSSVPPLNISRINKVDRKRDEQQDIENGY